MATVGLPPPLSQTRPVRRQFSWELCEGHLLRGLSGSIWGQDGYRAVSGLQQRHLDARKRACPHKTQDFWITVGSKPPQNIEHFLHHTHVGSGQGLLKACEEPQKGLLAMENSLGNVLFPIFMSPSHKSPYIYRNIPPRNRKRLDEAKGHFEFC